MRQKGMRLIGLLATIGAAVCGPPASAAPDFDNIERSVVRIVNVVQNGFGTGTGFVVNADGLVATNHHVIADSARLVVVPSNTREEHEAEVLWSSPDLDLAVLRVQGLALPAVTLSTATPRKGETVWSFGFPGSADRNELARDATLTDGVLSRVYSGAWTSQRLVVLQHTAELNPGNSGGPLLDDCGRVIGVNTQAALMGVEAPNGQMTRIPQASGIFWASHIDELAQVLRAGAITFDASADVCQQGFQGGAPEDEQARREAEEARGRADQANREAERARDEAGAALREAMRAVEEAERAQQRAEQLLKQMVLGGTALGVLGIAALGVALRKPRERIVRMVDSLSRRIGPTSMQPRPGSGRSSGDAPPYGVMLTGAATGAGQISLPLSAAALAASPFGLAIGRHPELVDFCVDNDKVSRRHFRVAWRDRRFYIEDLNSSNGTLLNGMPLAPFRPAPLEPGMSVTFGGWTLHAAKL